MKGKNIKIFFFVFIPALLIDQLSKIFIKRLLQESGSINIFRHFSLTFVENPGIGFGLLSGHMIRIPLIIISSAIAVILLVHVIRDSGKSRLQKISAGFVEAGIIGNLIDRIRYGAVVDFLDFHIWPVFNFADTFIVCGVILFMYIHLTEERTPSS